MQTINNQTLSELMLYETYLAYEDELPISFNTKFRR